MIRDPFLDDTGWTPRKVYPKEFTACDRLDEATREMLRENGRGLGPKFSSAQQMVVAVLFTKGYKSFNAVRILAEKGCGEDAYIIVRSLINLSIDLAYIRQDSSGVRALDWFFAGGKAALTLLERLGEKPKKETAFILERAKAWRSVNIAEKAKITGATSFYKLGYHDGSSYEHSDSVIFATYGTAHEHGVQFYPWPRAQLVDHSLKSAFVVFLAVLDEWALTFEIESERFGELRDLGNSLGSKKGTNTDDDLERLSMS